jgi:hypothetical protein
MSPPSLGLKNTPSKKPAGSKQSFVYFAFWLLHARFSPDLLYNPENGGEMFLWNVDWLSADYTALYPKNRTLYKHRCENLKSYTILVESEVWKIEMGMHFFIVLLFSEKIFKGHGL